MPPRLAPCPAAQSHAEPHRDARIRKYRFPSRGLASRLAHLVLLLPQHKQHCRRFSLPRSFAFAVPPTRPTAPAPPPPPAILVDPRIPPSLLSDPFSPEVDRQTRRVRFNETLKQPWLWRLQSPACHWRRPCALVCKAEGCWALGLYKARKAFLRNVLRLEHPRLHPKPSSPDRQPETPNPKPPNPGPLACNWPRCGHRCRHRSASERWRAWARATGGQAPSTLTLWKRPSLKPLQ